MLAIYVKSSECLGQYKNHRLDVIQAVSKTAGLLSRLMSKVSEQGEASVYKKIGACNEARIITDQECNSSSNVLWSPNPLYNHPINTLLHLLVQTDAYTISNASSGGCQSRTWTHRIDPAEVDFVALP